MMVPPISHTDRGVYLDTNVDEGEYTYIDTVLYEKDSHPYEQLKGRPQMSVKAEPEQDSSGKREQELKPAETVKTEGGPQSSKSCCRRLPCWVWVVIITCLVLAVTVAALLAYFLTSTDSTANPTATNDVTIDTTSTILPAAANPTITTSTTDGTSKPGPKDCQAAYQNGGTTSGVYSIYPDGQKEVRVYCEQTLRGGGWTVFQRRFDGSVNFYLYWADYKAGFGDPSGEYWVGNDNLHTLTANMDTQLLVELQYGGETQYAQYTEFWVLGEDQNYQLHVSGYSGGDPPGDSLLYHNDGAPGSCAPAWSGAWWYWQCAMSNLNGVYNMNSISGIVWKSWKGINTSLSAVRMLVKTK